MKQQPIWFQCGLETIQEGVDKMLNILEGEPREPFFSSLYVELYTIVSHLATQDIDHSTRLYGVYPEIFKKYLRSIVLPRLKEKCGECMLREFVRRWTDNKRMKGWLSRAIRYSGCCYKIRRSSLSCLELIAVKSFRDLVYSEVKESVKDYAIAMISKECKGKKIDILLLENVLKVFKEMGKEEDNGKCYEEDFEKHLIEETGVYYSHKASSWIVECSFTDYLRRAQKSLQKEQRRVSQYLCLATVEKLVKRAQHELLVVPEKLLLEKEGLELRLLFAAGILEDLSRMFRIYDRTPGGLERFATAFRDYVQDEGIALLQEAGPLQDHVLVSRLIELHDRFTRYVKDCFNEHNLFRKSLKDAFEMLRTNNVGETSTAEIFASFFNTTLKKKQIDEETEEKLRRAVALLVYINEKDLISVLYRKMFGQGLLNFDQSPNDVLTKLKVLSSRQLTSLMGGMLKDLISAKQNHNSFKEFLAHNPSLDPGFDFSATVLTPGFWPRYKTFDINLPVEMEKPLQSFKMFYETKTNHRKLRWVYSLGHCRLLGRFDEKSIVLVVTAHQAAALLLFNSSDWLSFSEITSRLNLFPEDLVRLLHSLCLDKYRILTKKPDVNTISQSDIFEFNAEFTDRTRKICLPQPAMANKGKKLGEEVNRDRGYSIDAAIVRIMKSRKVLELGELVSECVDQLRRSFKPDIKAIKKRVEVLIEREFLERDPTDHNTFRYLA